MANPWFDPVSLANPTAPAGQLNHPPPPPPLPPDPPDLTDFPPLASPQSHSPSSSSPPKTRARLTGPSSQLVSTRPPRHNTAAKNTALVANTPHSSGTVTATPPKNPKATSKLPTPPPHPTNTAPPPPLLPTPTAKTTSKPTPPSTSKPPNPETTPPAAIPAQTPNEGPPSTPTKQYSVPPVQEANSWANTVKKNIDKTLKPVDSVFTTAEGVPRVVIPDSVFKTGASLHKDFIKGFFSGKPPSLGQIQSVLNHMWGKGCNLEIHVNQLTRTMLVRIPNEYIRSKVLEKEYWHVGNSLFRVTPWNSTTSSSPSFSSIPLWAHVSGLDFDLMHQEGLSYVASLIGEPLEIDDWTLKLSSTSEAHLKVKVNLTKAPPQVVEAERENGSVMRLDVHYPWLPPICSHCKQIGHPVKLCHLSTQSWVPVTKTPQPSSSPTSDQPSPVNPPPPTAPSSDLQSENSFISNSNIAPHSNTSTQPTSSCPPPPSTTPPPEISPPIPLNPNLPINSSSPKKPTHNHQISKSSFVSLINSFDDSLNPSFCTNPRGSLLSKGETSNPL